MAEERKTDCSAFCPKCGTDLYYAHGVCYCKNKDCNYKCEKCRKEKEKLHYSD